MRLVTRRARRLAAAVLIAGALGSVTTAGATAPAAADTPSVTVTPDAVTHGQTVSIAISSLAPGPASYAVMQCGARAEDTAYPAFWDDCRYLAVYPDESVPPATLEATVEERFAPKYDGPTVDCVTDVGGCIVGVFRLAGGLQELLAYDRLTFPPRLDVSPSRNLGDGDTVAVTADEVPPGDWSVVQCTAAASSTPATCRHRVPVVSPRPGARRKLRGGHSADPRPAGRQRRVHDSVRVGRVRTRPRVRCRPVPNVRAHRVRATHDDGGPVRGPVPLGQRRRHRHRHARRHRHAVGVSAALRTRHMWGARASG